MYTYIHYNACMLVVERNNNIVKDKIRTSYDARTSSISQNRLHVYTIILEGVTLYACMGRCIKVYMLTMHACMLVL